MEYFPVTFFVPLYFMGYRETFGSGSKDWIPGCHFVVRYHGILSSHVQYSTVQYTTVHYSTVHYSQTVVQYITVLYSTAVFG